MLEPRDDFSKKVFRPATYQYGHALSVSILKTPHYNGYTLRDAL